MVHFNWIKLETVNISRYWLKLFLAVRYDFHLGFCNLRLNVNVTLGLKPLEKCQRLVVRVQIKSKHRVTFGKIANRE